MARVLLIGLDGAAFEYMDPWIEQGELPNIQSLLESGSYGTLNSTFLPITATAWPSMLTGKNAGKHGLYDFRYRPAGSYRLLPSPQLGMAGNPLHSYLSELGYRVGMINVPMTYPVHHVNGEMISGFLTPEGASDWVWPPDLPATLADHGAPYPLDLLHQLLQIEKLRRVDHDIEGFVSGWGSFTEAQISAAGVLLQMHDYDFFMIVISSTDHINHHTPDLAYIKQIYRQADRAIGELLKKTKEDTTVLVVSDHGSAPLERYFVLNRFLSDLGLTRFRREVSARFIRRVASKITWKHQKRPESWWLRLPRSVRTLLSAPLLLGDDRLRYDYDNIDWRQSRAFADSGNGIIHINVRGREPQGIVDPGQEYDDLCQEIIDALKAIIDPVDGRPIIAEAHRGRDYFSGPFVDRAPDIIFRRQDERLRAITGFATDPLIRSSRRADGRSAEYGYHTRDGILIAAGPGVRKASLQADIHDIAPTVLHILGEPIPDDIDGKVLNQLFNDPQPVRMKAMGPPPASAGAAAIAKYTEDDQVDFEDRLRSLGYLD